MVGWLGENVRHHGLLLAAKKLRTGSKTIPKIKFENQKINDTKPLIWSCLSINFRLCGRFLKSIKTSKKDLSHNNSFCWPRWFGYYFVCKRFPVHSSPPVITGICDPTKSRSQYSSP